ncbi:MAG: type II toxin-antitoxin system RelE/ParE family toxin [Planctomycetes bacterium]|nr:type II toxin-antitoxin system RelE/ParE family toxin [Planctomycetota bacterium]
MKVVWDPEAQQQLNAILEAIAKENPAAAMDWLDELDALLQNAAAFPESGRMAPGRNDPSVCEIIHGDYLVAYLVNRKRIEVLTIWHGARKPPGRGLAGVVEDE